MIVTNNIEQALKLLDMPNLLQFDDVQVKRISSFSANPTNLQIKIVYQNESYIYEIIAPENEQAVII